MKLKTKLLSLVSTSLLSASAIAPAILLTSCSGNETDPMVEPLKEETIKQFKEIAKIYRPSNNPSEGKTTNLTKIRNYCIETIKTLGLEPVDQGDQIKDGDK